MKILPHTGQINPGSLMAAALVRKTYSVRSQKPERQADTPMFTVTSVGHLSNISPF